MARRDPARIDELMGELTALAKRHPEIRHGQTLINLLKLEYRDADPADLGALLFNLEDDRLLELIRGCGW